MSDNSRKLLDLLEEMKSEGALGEYIHTSPADLAYAFKLTDQEGDDLYYLIHREFEPLSNVDLKDIPTYVIKEYLLETEYGGCEGFTEHEEIVFTKFMDDLRLFNANYEK